MNAHPPIDVSRIVRVVAELTGVSERTILADERDARSSRARDLAFYLVRYPVGQKAIPAPPIGEAFGKDYKSVLLGIGRAAMRIEEEPRFKELVERARAILAAEGTGK